jgi:D-alanyl-D-alanine dipeptidase
VGKTLAFLLAVLFLSPVLEAGPSLKRVKGSPLRSLRALEKDPDYVDLAAFPHVRVDLKYATTDNFMGIDMYGPFRKAFLHKDAAAMFRKAVDLLEKDHPGYSFIVFDALRPHSVQWIMWDRVKDTPQRKYVANAEIGSPHNFGMAVDLSLLDEKGKELDMGTPFDSFSEVSEPQLEEKFLKEGKLTKAQMENRLILRRAMTGAGFIQLSHEWWHYNGLPEPEIRKKYKIVE